MVYIICFSKKKNTYLCFSIKKNSFYKKMYYLKITLYGNFFIKISLFSLMSLWFRKKKNRIVYIKNFFFLIYNIFKSKILKLNNLVYIIIYIINLFYEK